MSRCAVFKKSKNIVSRVIAGETVLLPIYKTSEEINCIYTLNKAAAFVWDHIDGKHSLDSIRELVLKEFAVTPQAADRDMAKLIKELDDIEAIVA